MQLQNLIKFQQFVHKILSRNKISTNTKGHNCVVNLQKLTRNNPNVDLVMVYAYAKFDQMPSIGSHDIEWKRNLTIIKGHYCVV